MLAAVCACAAPGGADGLSVPTGEPVVLRGEAPDYAREAVVARIGDGAVPSAILRTYRLDETDAERLAARAVPNVRWWLVVPPAQPSGGYRLRVTPGDGGADVCLAPPQGPAAAAFVKPAYLVGLPRDAGALRWRGACPVERPARGGRGIADGPFLRPAVVPE